MGDYEVSDYCFCGSLATARCGCGATVCSIHKRHPQPHHNTALMVAARLHEGRPDYQLFTALNNAWSAYPGIMCGNCYGRAIDEVAVGYSRAFQDHTDARAETIAVALVKNGSWTTGMEYGAGESIGQKTLRAAGHHMPWSHPDPLDTAGRLYAFRHGEPPETPISMKRWTERKKLFGGTQRVQSVTTWGSIKAWHLSAHYTDDGFPNSTTILLGATGVRKESQTISPQDGNYFYNENEASKAKSLLESDFQPLPTPGFYAAKESALLAVFTSDM